VPDEQPSPSDAAPVSHVQIQFTVDDGDRADAIIEQLLGARVVACGQRTGPVVSRYWWQGSLERKEEWLVLLKTRADLTERVIASVVAAHPYDTPEVVALDLWAGAPDYLAWIDRMTEPTGTIGRVGETEEP
jgi:periplasmic divalent cation tolerance protein